MNWFGLSVWVGTCVVAAVLDIGFKFTSPKLYLALGWLGGIIAMGYFHK